MFWFGSRVFCGEGNMAIYCGALAEHGIRFFKIGFPDMAPLDPLNFSDCFLLYPPNVDAGGQTGPAIVGDEPAFLSDTSEPPRLFFVARVRDGQGTTTTELFEAVANDLAAAQLPGLFPQDRLGSLGNPGGWEIQPRLSTVSCPSYKTAFHRGSILTFFFAIKSQTVLASTLFAAVLRNEYTGLAADRADIYWLDILLKTDGPAVDIGGPIASILSDLTGQALVVVRSPDRKSLIAFFNIDGQDTGWKSATIGITPMELGYGKSITVNDPNVQIGNSIAIVEGQLDDGVTYRGADVDNQTARLSELIYFTTTDGHIRLVRFGAETDQDNQIVSYRLFYDSENYDYGTPTDYQGNGMPISAETNALAASRMVASVPGRMGMLDLDFTEVQIVAQVDYTRDWGTAWALRTDLSGLSPYWIGELAPYESPDKGNFQGPYDTTWSELLIFWGHHSMLNFLASHLDDNAKKVEAENIVHIFGFCRVLPIPEVKQIDQAFPPPWLFVVRYRQFNTAAPYFDLVKVFPV